MKNKLFRCLASALCVITLLVLLPVPTMAETASKFRDVKTGDWCYDAVIWAVEEGITAGTTATTFSPNATCNNAQILTFLWRAAGQPTASIANPFSNVTSNDYYYQAALWAYENKLVSGATFDANANCTRRMAVTYIWTAKGKPFSQSPAHFSDVPVQDYDLLAPVSWAVENGVTSGTSKTTFSPNDTCTRAQIVAFLNRAYGNGTAPSVNTTPTPSTDTQGMSAECTELLKLINAKRTEAGLKTLAANNSLTQAAKLRADDISKGYIDNRADGSSWDSVVTGLPNNVTDLHETMVGGSGTASGIFGIMSSEPDATAAMLAGDYTQVGIGHVYNANGYGGLQDFWSVLYIAEDTASSGTGTTNQAEGNSLQAQRQGVLDLVNSYRAQSGLAPLVLDEALCSAAQVRANEIVQSFSHTRPDGTTCFTALKEANISYGTAGENIAAGSSTPAGVMEQWMNSPGHRDNIMKAEYRAIGIGYVQVGSGYGHYWVQMFTN